MTKYFVNSKALDELHTRNKAAIVKLLKEVVKGELSNLDNQICGLCNNLKCAVEDLPNGEQITIKSSSVFGDSFNEHFAYSFVKEHCKTWSHFNGNEGYPVPYTHDVGMYEGENLAYRQSLAKHLLTKIDVFFKERLNYWVEKDID